MAWTDETIETERTRLRAFCETDKPAIVALASSSEVRRYLGGPIHAEQIVNIDRATVGERWGIFCVAAVDSDEAFGSVSFDRGRGELEISYELLPSHWGRGHADEAVGAAIAWAWANTDDAAMIAVTQVKNIPSVRLLERLGFAPDAEFDEFGARQRQFRLARRAADPI